MLMIQKRIGKTYWLVRLIELRPMRSRRIVRKRFTRTRVSNGWLDDPGTDLVVHDRRVVCIDGQIYLRGTSEFSECLVQPVEHHCQGGEQRL